MQTFKNIEEIPGEAVPEQPLPVIDVPGPADESSSGQPAGSPDQEKVNVDKYLFTPRIRPDRRAEAFLEEWVRRFSRA